MPFDSSGTQLLDYKLTNIADPFERLGIVPVRDDFVARHKKDYGAEWRLMHPNQFGRWQTTTYKPQRIEKSLGRPITLREFLANPTRNAAFSSDHSGAPKALVALALKVEQEAPDAVFSVDYFYDDPVLNVKIDGKKACLGIWDYFGDRVHVTAIATKVS